MNSATKSINLYSATGVTPTLKINQKDTPVFKDDIGVIFRVYGGLNLSTATSITYKVEKPDMSQVTWTAVKETGDNFYATYTTVSGDLNLEGIYKLSLQISYAGGVTYKGRTADFVVYDQFEDKKSPQWDDVYRSTR